MVQKCDFCDKTCITKGGLTRHVKIVHLDKPRECKTHVCDYCDKVFYSRKHLDIHLSVHTGKRDHKCPICNRAFVTIWNIWTHMKSKHHARQVKNFSRSNLNTELEFFVAKYKDFTEFYRMYKEHYEKYHHGNSHTYTNLEKVLNWSGSKGSNEQVGADGEGEDESYSDEDSEESDWEENLKDIEVEIGLY